MKLPILLLLGLASFLPSANAQWTKHVLPATAENDKIHVSLICSDSYSDTTLLFTYDTSYHLYSYTPQSGFQAYPEYDAMLDVGMSFYDAKIKKGILWCTTPAGLKKWDAGTWMTYPYPDQFQASAGGLYIANDGSVWFPGGKFGNGFTRFDGTSWTNISQATHPEFLQDMGVSDIEMDESRQELWIGTNCFSQFSGVYRYSLQTNRLTKIDNGNAKYGCIHGVLPIGNKVFVGTSNFSSIRVLENDNYTQSLEAPKVKWVTDIVAAPFDSSAVWVLNDYGITFFKDINNYHYFDTLSTPLRGIMNGTSSQKLGEDSAIVWIGTTEGVYSYRYKKSTIPVSVREVSSSESLCSVYPNPTTGSLWVEAKESEITQINLATLLGEQTTIPITETDGMLRLDLSGLANGIYFLHITTRSATEVRRIEILH